MFRHLSVHLFAALTLFSAAYLYHAADIPGYAKALAELIDDSGSIDDSAPEAYDEDPLSYNPGDWNEYVLNEQYNRLLNGTGGNIYSGDTINIDSYGSVRLNFIYGRSFFTDDKYKQFDEDKPVSSLVSQGFTPEQVIQLHVEGSVGDRIKVFIDHDSEREENTYLMQYRAVGDDEILREINAGQIDIRFNHSRYAVYDNTDAKALGVDFTVKKDRLQIKAFGSIARGETAVEYFRGNTSSGNTKLGEYQYLKKTYYQLEPFVRYDNLSAIPSGSGSYNLITFTSAPSDPATYAPYPVNISSGGFELYIDDQNQYNNNNAIQLPIDGGYYTRLVNGTDYSINYTTGVIRFIRTIPDNARIFAAYTRSGGTMDPCALTDSDPKHPGGTFAGKIFVFIKYGASTNEDIVAKNFSLDSGEDLNGDGRLNLDVYEIRSYYSLGVKQLVSGSLAIEFYDENSSMTGDEVLALGSYKVDTTTGILNFNTREPFRKYIASSSLAKIYAESRPQDVYIYSRYALKAAYQVEARSFQLRNSNIIENSVRIRVNGIELNSSKYNVDYLSGFLSFPDQSCPLIGPETLIEVKYEYLPFGTGSQNFIGGLRMDYQLSRDISVGGSLVISRGNESLTIPDIGSESDQTIVYEGDVSLNLSQGRIAEIFNLFTGGDMKSAPLEFTAYGEYARSYTEVNTFGKALIDNMESSDETIVVSMSEKDWVLSSMPASLSQAARGLLYYRFYRNPDSPDDLKGESFKYYSIDYAVKPGPYNIATGHVNSSITKTSDQRSLVLDYAFDSSASCASIVTRKFSESAVDLSGIQYIEVWVRLDPGSGSDSVQLKLDAGTVNEDSDSDGVLDTEDANGNGYIDSTSGSSEDKGYSFNGSNTTVVGSGPGLDSGTSGDGKLNTEDLDSSGTLGTANNVVTFDLATVTASSGTWQKIRFYVDLSTLTSAQVETLKNVTSLRLYVIKNTGTSGRLFIDSLQLVTSRWKNPAMDGSYLFTPDPMKITVVSSINDSDYFSESFIRTHSSLYGSLYGGDTDDYDNTNESALQVEFNIPATNSNVSVTRSFAKAIDISHYSTLNMWINVRAFTAESIGIIIGSSDYDFVEYRYLPLHSLLWEEVSLKLDGHSGGNTSSYSVTGDPDMKRIKYIRLVVYGSGATGKFWLNEIYVSEPETLEGDAQWYECQLKMKRPLAVTGSGTPVLSDMLVRYIYKGNSSNFNTVNKTTTDISLSYNEIFTSSNILPNWRADMTYTKEKSSTDSLNEMVEDEKRGEYERDFFTLNSVFTSTGGMVPDITFSYTVKDAGNVRELDVSGYDYDEEKSSTIHTPVISYRQRFDDFLYGRLMTDAGLSMVFSDTRMERDSGSISDTSLSSYVSLSDIEKKQRSLGTLKLDYTNSIFFLRETAEIISEEYVQSGGDDLYSETGISRNVSWGYHLPFSNSSDMKYVERSRGTSFTTGITWFDYLRPEYSISLNYKENTFRDYETAIDDFDRSKGANSVMTSEFKIPLLLNKVSFLKNVRNLQFNYSRSLYLNEADVPYEGEGYDTFSEEYGISRVCSRLGSGAWNIFSYYPGYFLGGRDNSANGRDYVYDTLNKTVESGSGSEYDNALRFTDRFTMDFAVGNESVDLSLTAGINQVCERTNIYGVPGQVITDRCGLALELNLMELLEAGFFRNNTENNSYHASVFEIGSDFEMNDIITSNIREFSLSPYTGLTFKIDRSSIGLRFGIDLTRRKDHIFIDTSLEEGDADYIYLMNIEGSRDFRENDNGYLLNLLFETDVKWLSDFFSLFYPLSGMPIFNISYKMEINRYDYINSVSPEPYDLHLVESSLSLDLHKNVRGGLSGRWALEKYRNRDTEVVNREIMSYEASGSISLIF